MKTNPTLTLEVKEIKDPFPYKLFRIKPGVMVMRDASKSPERLIKQLEYLKEKGEYLPTENDYLAVVHTKHTVIAV
jgi:hypothetical protein